MTRMAIVARRRVRIDDIDAAAFWARVDRSDGDNCWRWLGAVGGNGYGYITVGSNQCGAHRASLILATNGDRELFALHSCNNPGANAADRRADRRDHGPPRTDRPRLGLRAVPREGERGR